ncbi:hypothetical protein FQN54_003333 [Arachnomyces sp. PD_36]|nr:hypothetical protein FQN54_003333 [Arachnomyces sp. PD_36]
MRAVIPYPGSVMLGAAIQKVVSGVIPVFNMNLQMNVSDPARGYCQPAALDSESESRLFTCTSAVFDRQINLPSRRDHLDTAGFDPSSYRTDSHTFELKSKRSALHQYPKRYTYTTVGGVLGSIFFLIIAGIVFFLIFRRRRRVIYPAAPAASAAASSSANATGNTATTNVYVMGSQQQPMPQQQQPITMQPIIPAQPYPPQQQTVYSNSPPPQQEYSYATTNAIHAPANPSYNSYPPPQPQPQAYPNVITPAPAPGPSEPLPTYKDQSKM